MRNLIILLLMILLPLGSSAQEIKNTAFRSGETLTYNLYFNWKFVWVNVGSASMTTRETVYKGQKAYCTALTTHTSAKVDKMFMLRDTLKCYTTLGLRPLYFRKGAREGKRYYVDELFYSYANNKVSVTTKALHNDGKRTSAHLTSQSYIYDMLSIFLRARNYSTDGWKPGHYVKFSIADGDGMQTAYLKYQGKSTVKGDDGKKYKCLELSYIEREDGKQKEIVRFFVTDDAKHLPVRLDLNLKFGSAKAFLKASKL